MAYWLGGLAFKGEIAGSSLCGPWLGKCVVTGYSFHWIPVSEKT